MPLTTFLTATGFLAAILLVWAQSWLNAYKPAPLPPTVGLGLAWTYLAVIIALVAFAWAGWSYWRRPRIANFRVRGFPLGLLVGTLVMTVINVAQSLVFTVVKMLIFKDNQFKQPAVEITDMPITLIVLGCVVPFIIIMSWLGTKWRWWWVVEVGSLVVGGVLFLVALWEDWLPFIKLINPHTG